MDATIRHQTIKLLGAALSSLSSPTGLAPLLRTGLQSPSLCCRALEIQKSRGRMFLWLLSSCCPSSDTQVSTESSQGFTQSLLCLEQVLKWSSGPLRYMFKALLSALHDPPGLSDYLGVWRRESPPGFPQVDPTWEEIKGNRCSIWWSSIWLEITDHTSTFFSWHCHGTKLLMTLCRYP